MVFIFCHLDPTKKKKKNYKLYFCTIHYEFEGTAIPTYSPKI